MPPTYPLTGTAAAELEARLANFRLGQSRLGFMNPTLRMTVGGTDRSTLVDKYSIRVTYRLNQPSVASMTVFGFTPTEGQEIKIAIGAITNLLFAGHITQVKQIADGLRTNVKYSISCQDYSWLLDRRRVFRSYLTSDSCESVINDLMASFSSGFTTTHVQQGLGQITGMPFTMETLSGCLNRLAEKFSANWHIDPVKDLHFYSTDRVPTPHDLTTAYTDFENVALSVDLSQVRTRIYVEGAGSVVSSNFTYGDAVLNLDTAVDFSTSGGDVRVGQYAPLGANRMRYTAVSGGPPVNQLLGFGGAPDNLNTDLRNLFPSIIPLGTEINIWVQVEDSAAQAALAALEGGDGIHEDYIQDRRLNTDGATARGNAELTKNKNPKETLTYRTHDPNTRPGAKVTANLNSPTNISGTFTIQSVTVNAIEQAYNRHPWYEVEATSVQRTLWDVYQDFLNKANRI